VIAAASILYSIYKTVPSAQAKDLLFSTGNIEEMSKRTDARLKEMESTYLEALGCFLLSGAVFWIAVAIAQTVDADEPSAGEDVDSSARRQQHSRAAGRARSVIVGQDILSLLLVFQLLLLPMIYGQTVYSNNYHKVMVEDTVMEEALRAHLPASNSIWLIKENPVSSSTTATSSS
jgi:hypothetical protein